MKSTLSIALIALALPLAAQAGGGKYVVEKNPVVAAPCYDGGFEFGIFGSAIFPESHYDDALGGGVSLAYFYNENLGFDLGAAWYATGSEVHNYTLDAVYRLPFDCIAPYILVGGGLHTNGETEGLFRFGGGVDYRFSTSTSVFADGIYNIAGGDVDNYAIARLGLRFSF